MTTTQHKIVVLGSQGMLGHMVYDVLKTNDNNIVFPLTRNEIDFRNFNKLKRFLSILHPTTIINCAGILIRQSENNPEEAKIINTDLPTMLSSFCKTKSIQFIHISTDCVFNGNKFRHYTLNDIQDAQNVYGKTKADAENNLLKNKYGLILRTSIIGPEIKEHATGLFHWALTNTAPEIEGYTQVYWNGVTTLYLANIIQQLLDHKEMHGLYHVVGEDTSKYTVIKILKGLWNKSYIVKPNRTIKKYMCLTPDIFQVKSQFEMLTELLAYMRNNKSKYEIYF